MREGLRERNDWWDPEQSDSWRRWDINRSFNNELHLEGKKRGKKGTEQGDGQPRLKDRSVRANEVQICLQQWRCQAQVWSWRTTRVCAPSGEGSAGPAGTEFLIQETRGIERAHNREEEVLKARGRVWKVANGEVQSRSLGPGTERDSREMIARPRDETGNPRVCNDHLEQVTSPA